MPVLILLTILVVIIGMFAGSLVNVLVFRTNEQKKLFKRSRCPSCNQKIALIDLIPIINFIYLRGKCRHCSSSIHWQYPVVELVVGTLFGLFFARIWLGIGIPEFVAFHEYAIIFVRDVLIGMFLLVIFIYDLQYEKILDRYSIPAILVAIFFNVALGFSSVFMILGALFIGSFFALQFLISKGRWIGGGDIRLGLLMGFLLGLEVGVVALFLAYILGAIIGVYLILAKKRKIDSYVPFGTFLAGATIICMLFGEKIWNSYIAFF